MWQSEMFEASGVSDVGRLAVGRGDVSAPRLALPLQLRWMGARGAMGASC